MKKSKSKKQDKKGKTLKPSSAPGKEKQADEARENPFDFGGLPNRDLKKNLGCG